MRSKLDGQLRKIFIHAGIVTSVDLDWKDESEVRIKVSWIPWSYCGLEHVTQQLLDAGTITNDELLYFRAKNTTDVVTGTLTIDFTNESWQQDFIKQIGLIIIREVKMSMVESE